MFHEFADNYDNIIVNSYLNLIDTFFHMYRFTSRTQQAIQYVLFKTTLTMGFTVISGGFPMLYVNIYV